LRPSGKRNQRRRKAATKQADPDTLALCDV